MLIQSTHFPSAMSYYQMGYKSVVVNISDLIAMGAEPVGFLLNIAIPKDLLLDDFKDLICGVIGACDKYDMPLIGGDTNESNEIIITGVAMGKIEKDMALMKYGFNEGDLVCITGELGLAALGFELLDENRRAVAEEIDRTLVDMAIFKALKPEANYENGRVLANYKKDFNVSATDITDGLASELYELLRADKAFNDNGRNGESGNSSCVESGNISCVESGNSSYVESGKVSCVESGNSYSKGIRIYEDRLPIEDEFKEISKALDLDYLDLFFHVGEDFELLFTIPRELEKKITEEMNFYVIGEITDKNTVEIVLSNGETVPISSKGYEHLN